jgi:hypothetical protein
MNSEAENPREHEPDETRDRNISIDEALSLFSTKLKSVIREERANFRNELEEQVTDIKRDLVLKRPANKELVNFKYSGCKNQFDFNSQRITEIELAEDYLRFARIEEAREVLKQTKDSLRERNTHVKIADKYGWDTLEEYVGDDFVTGSDEREKLRRAESRAVKRRKDRKPYDRKNDTGTGAVMQNDIFRFNNPAAIKQYVDQTFNQQQQTPGSFSKSWPATQPPSRFPYPKPPQCFYCFGDGHIATHCPLKLQTYGRVSLPTATITNAEENKSK